MTSMQNMGSEDVKFNWKPVGIATGRFALLLIAVQALRAVIYQALYAGLTLAGMEHDDIFWIVISVAAFILVGVLLLAAFHPGAVQLGLDWQGTSRRERVFTAAGGSLLVVLAGINLVINPSQLPATLDGCLVVPLFEELLFRGWGWKMIEPTLPSRWRGWGTTLIVTAFFGLWHLGYADVVAMHMSAYPRLAAPLGWVMVMKVAIGAAVGLLTGLARWRTGHVYGSFIVHALWNLFGK